MTTLREAAGGLGSRNALVGGRVPFQHAEHGGLGAVGEVGGVERVGPDGFGRRVRQVAAHERQPAAEIDPLGLDRGPAQRRHHPGMDGVAVEGDLELAVEALEALLGEAEAGGVLVEPLEHGPQRGLGLLAAKPVHA